MKSVWGRDARLIGLVVAAVGLALVSVYWFHNEIASSTRGRLQPLAPLFAGCGFAWCAGRLDPERVTLFREGSSGLTRRLRGEKWSGTKVGSVSATLLVVFGIGVASQPMFAFGTFWLITMSLIIGSDVDIVPITERSVVESGNAGPSARRAVPGGADPIDAECGADEHVLWRGRPDPRRHLNWRDVFFVPFSLAWSGVAVIWEWLAITSGASAFFVLFGVFLIAWALYLLVGRFWVKASRKRCTWYAITDRRILVIEERKRRTIRELPVRNARVGYRILHGEILFGDAPKMWANLIANTGTDGPFFISSGSMPIAFFDVPNAGLVEQFLYPKIS